MQTIGYAAASAQSSLEPYHYECRELRDNDVAIEILYSGVCHSDLHTVKNDWGWTVYPTVPGHEIVGRVVQVGSQVNKYKVGDHVAVGCMVDSCQECTHCHHGEEQFCEQGFTQTYNSADRHTQELTKGGYAKHIVVRQEFVLSIPASLDLAKVAPLLCAGITTYSPLRTWNVGPGSQVAVIGMGGLGHMAIKLAAAMGAHVTVLSRSESKRSDALELGASDFLISSDLERMQQAANRFELIIDTVPTKHDITPYLPLLNVDGTLTLVGQVGPIAEVNTVPMVMGRRRIAASLIGGIAETQEMLDFCGRMNILPEVEMIKMEQINEAFERLEKSDVHYRFVIDMQASSF
ncbi:NADP-dependent alcohol dehydrogenase C 2 [Shewanella putrefaciens]|uniref:NAD(P)-dependent alcohol dehydrogenase n=1 Tax=Shewanella sp. GD04112 TaxID=2975434 RepID=UPI000F6EFE9A|nr:NAD(P)-dependent alcohol dehydrogenase [Shewanella sp. GD04112]MDH0448320.1 NAD(P)-dependent alcohol dehydrogenase [Shewanella sp. GD04112]VEE63907.1 NADP-dependent alcohol dehydrogenase C 2 [Shewanella putrefaciens]